MNNLENDINLLIIEAVEGYAYNHKISSSEALDVFKKYNIIKLIKSQYDVLHTQSLDESINFVEDVVRRKQHVN